MIDGGFCSEHNLIIGFQLHAPANVRVMTGIECFVKTSYGVENVAPKRNIAGTGIWKKRMVEIDRLRQMPFGVKIGTQFTSAINQPNFTGDAADFGISEWLQHAV